MLQKSMVTMKERPTSAPKHKSKPSRRSAARRTMRRRRRLVTLKTFVGQCLLAGPRAQLPVERWEQVQMNLPRAITATTYQPSSKQNAMPRFCQELFSACEISTYATETTFLETCRSTAQRYCRSLERGGHIKLLDGENNQQLSVDSYSLSKLTRAKIYRPLVVDKVALPPEGTVPVDLVKTLQWPYNKLFSAEVLRRCRRTQEEKESTGPAPRGHVAMDKGESYPALCLRMKASGMVKFFPSHKAPHGPTNGLFGVLKGQDQIRLILNGKPGNFDWCPKKLHREYLKIIQEDPARARALGLNERFMPIPSPGDLVQAPWGVYAVGESDFASYFYTLQQIPELWGSQRLQPIQGRDIGRSPGLWVPVMTVMSMGSWLAAQLAQFIHRDVMGDLGRKPFYLKPVDQQTASRKALYATLGDAQYVRKDAVPPELVRELKKAGHAGFERLPADLLIPRDVFELQMSAATERDELSTMVEVSTFVFSDGQPMRFALAEAAERTRRTRREQYVAMASLYIDDNASLYYGPQTIAPTTARGDDQQDKAVAHLHHLLAISAAVGKGLRLALSKLKWPSADGGKALGVDYEFTDKNTLRLEVNPEKRQATANALVAVSRTDAPYVAEDLLDSLLGDYVWQALCRRPFLSALRVAYKARHSHNRPPGMVLLTPQLRHELWTTSLLAPTLFTETVGINDQLITYDASGANHQGNGGYGVAFRGGLTALAAAELTWSVGGQLGRLAGYREPSPGRPPPERLVDRSHKEACRQATRLLKFDWESEKNPWTAAQRGEFSKAPPYIAVGEALTAVMAAKTAVRRPRARGQRNLIGGDNTVACTALHKGRSSCRPINTACRRAAVIGFVQNTYFNWFWIPSKSNAADGPSRWWLEPPAAKLGRRRRCWVRDLTQDGDVHPHPGPPPSKTRHRYAGGKYKVPDNMDDLHDLLGPAVLKANSVRHDTLEKYLSAYDGLQTFLHEHQREYGSLSTALEGFVETCFHEKILTKSQVMEAMSALVFFDGTLKTRGETKAAWRAISGWKKFVPTQNRIPVPKHLLQLFALTLLSRPEREAQHAGIALLLGFDTYMRSGELCELKVEDIVLPGNPANFSKDHGVVHTKHRDRRRGDPEKAARSNKSSRNQGVTLDNDDIIDIMRAFISGRDVNERLFQLSGSAALLKWLRVAEKEVGYLKPVFMTHSVRGGGATHDLHSKRRLFLDIKLRGRWGSDKVTRSYLNQGQALLQADMVPDQVRNWFGKDLNKAQRKLKRLFKRRRGRQW